MNARKLSEEDSTISKKTSSSSLFKFIKKLSCSLFYYFIAASCWGFGMIKILSFCTPHSLKQSGYTWSFTAEISSFHSSSVIFRSSRIVKYLSCCVMFALLTKFVTNLFLGLILTKLPKRSKESRRVVTVRLWSNRTSSRRSKSCKVEDMKYLAF